MPTGKYKKEKERESEKDNGKKERKRKIKTMWTRNEVHRREIGLHHYQPHS